MKIKQVSFLCGFFILAKAMLKDLGTEGETQERDSTVVIFKRYERGKRRKDHKTKAW